MFRGLFSRKRALTGAPAAPRMKSYSAQSGYVYQYFYEGRRLLGRGGKTTEFVFRVSADRSNWGAASVVLDRAECREWERAHAREFAENERYALAKMALFQAFDERPSPASMREPVRVRAADVAAIAEALGFES